MTENFLAKYSPQKIQDFFVDNYTIFDNDISLLISGPYGSGKTSLLIFYIHKYIGSDINIYNNENVLFLNNLKDQGIQFCRNNVKTFCQNSSIYPSCKKIIAIDDIDEFSDSSQQVICNFINKYSSNVLCIATCNNSLKVYTGLKSRMAFITIYPPTNNILHNLAMHIISRENIIINNSVIELIINSSNSSYKILINILQKFKLFNKPITENNIYELITSINSNTLTAYFEALYILDINGAIKIIYDVIESGISVIDILFEIFYYIQKTKHNMDEQLKYQIIQIISKYITIFNNSHEDSIEIAFMTNDILSIIKQHKTSII